MVGEPVAHVQGFQPKGRRAVFCRCTNSPIAKDQAWDRARGRTAFDPQGGTVMPIGTRYVLRGTLRTTLLGHVMEVETGEWWQLDIDPSTEIPVGRCVLAEGIRTGTHQLTVERLTLDEDAPLAERGPSQAPLAAQAPFAAMIQGVKRM